MSFYFCNDCFVDGFLHMSGELIEWIVSFWKHIDWETNVLHELWCGDYRMGTILSRVWSSSSPSRIISSTGTDRHSSTRTNHRKTATTKPAPKWYTKSPTATGHERETTVQCSCYYLYCSFNHWNVPLLHIVPWDCWFCSQLVHSQWHQEGKSLWSSLCNCWVGHVNCEHPSRN